jgi:KipI family sensor histidine kinase inhibitor
LHVRFADALSMPANRAALAFRGAVEAAQITGVTETTTALVSVSILFDPEQITHATLRAQLQKLLDARDWYAAPLPAGRRLWHIPAVFGGAAGPQLAEAAELAGRDPATAVAELTAVPVQVLTLGFAPGQPYLGELAPHWNLPRQQGLTPRVPAGALVIAVRQFTLFTNALPTGWRHIATTGFIPYQPDRPEPFVLRGGDGVQFHAVDALPAAPLGGAWSEDMDA